jgi:hypothetical protein
VRLARHRYRAALRGRCHRQQAGLAQQHPADDALGGPPFVEGAEPRPEGGA